MLVSLSREGYKTDNVDEINASTHAHTVHPQLNAGLLATAAAVELHTAEMSEDREMRV